MHKNANHELSILSVSVSSVPSRCAMAGILPYQSAYILMQMGLQEEQDALVVARWLCERNKMRKRRRYWVRPWLERRLLYGAYHSLMRELEAESPVDFINYMRMEPSMFREVLIRLSDRIRKKTTNFREPLEPGLKLAITLRHLATGESYRSLGLQFRVPHNTISLLVREVCESIVEEFQCEVILTPTCLDDWKHIAERFSTKWQFHHCLGALDGKHVAIKCPPESGSVYHNYRGFFSIILLALVDADYKFIWADVGANGSTSDCSIFNRSALRAGIEAETLNIPDPDPLPQDDKDTPYFIVGDDAFPLRLRLMKPFSKRDMTVEERVFNYRLSRARRIVENAFGILASRFQCLLGTMRQEPETVTSIIMAAMCLHNLMRMRYPSLQNAALDREDDEHRIIPGSWRQDGSLGDMEEVSGGNREAKEARKQRLYLKHYYNSAVGSVSWQLDRVLPEV